MPDLETQIRDYARHAVDTIPPVQTEHILSRTSGRFTIRRSIALGTVAATVLALLVVALIGTLRARHGPIQIADGERDAVSARVEGWTPAEPGWMLVVQSVEPSDESARADQLGEVHLLDPDSGKRRGTIQVGLSTEAAIGADGYLYLLTTRLVQDGQQRSSLSALDLHDGTLRWSRRLDEVWSRRVRLPTHHLTTSSDGSWIIAAKGLDLIAYSSTSGEESHHTNLENSCTRSIRDIARSWEPQAFFVLCGDELLEYSPATGDVRQIAGPLPELLRDYELRRGFPSRGGPAGSGASLVIDPETQRITILMADGRLVRIEGSAHGPVLGEPSDPLVPGGASTLLVPTGGLGDSIVVPLVGPEFCEPCGGRAGADHVVVVETDGLAVNGRYRHQDGFLDLEARPGEGEIYLLDATNYDIVVLDARSLQQKKRIPTGERAVSEILLVP